MELDALTANDMTRILKDPPDCILKEYTHLLSLDDIELKFTHNALRLLIDYAIETGLGARGLRSAMEEVMHDVMFDAPAKRGKKVTIDKRFIARRLTRLD